MVTIQLDMAADFFPRDLRDGEDATSICPPIRGIVPDKLVVRSAVGPGGGNPDCLATFEDETKARRWFAIVADDDSPSWFDDNVVA